MAHLSSRESHKMSVSRILIGAQEEERRRIARELHDDLSQRLSLLAANITHLQSDVAKKCSRRCATEVRDRLQALWEGTANILEDVESLSHELHSSILEQLGLRNAIAILCDGVSRRSNIKVQFIADKRLPAVSKDVSLCLYRIVQEGLRNVVQHSNAREAQVELKATADEVQLSICDHGTGFQPRLQKRGLGLVSMRERVHLVSGKLSIGSMPPHGTKILVRIPLR